MIRKYIFILFACLKTFYLIINVFDAGVMFVADGGSGESSPAIIKLSMTSSREHQVLATHGVEWPVSVAVDPLAGRVYWADLKLRTISSINYDGSGVRIVRKFDAIQPRTIVLFGDYIFCTASSTHGVFRIHKLAHSMASTDDGGTHSRRKSFLFQSVQRNTQKLLEQLYWVEFAARGAAIYVSSAAPESTPPTILSTSENNCPRCPNYSVCLRTTRNSYECQCPRNDTGLTSFMDCACLNVTCDDDEQCVDGLCNCSASSYCSSRKESASLASPYPWVFGSLVVLVISGTILFVLCKRRCHVWWVSFVSEIFSDNSVVY